MSAESITRRTAGILPQGGTVSNVNNYDPGTNRISGGSYDLAGNLAGLTGISLAYDAENRQTSATQNGIGTVTYLYDGNGQRVEKMFTSGGNTVYVYDVNGQLAAEYDMGSVPTPPCTTCYLSWDHLGSTRLVTDQSGNLVTRHDYLPFGEEIGGGSGGRNSEFGKSDFVRQKFTGKERDTETGLDYFGARYYGSALGRFASPDPKGIPAEFDDPQAWNKYAYTGNNPLRYTDPDGKDWKDVVAGAFNAIKSDNAFGAGRQTGNSDFQNGQAMGDVVAAGQGAVQMIVGAAGDAGGTLLDLTGVGALVGVPAQVVSTTVAVDGAGVTATAAGNLITQAKALPSGLVGTQDDKSGPVGNRHISGPLDPAHGGTGDPAKDFDTLTGGKNGPAPDGSRYPPGTQVGENGIASRPAKGNSGPRIDIPANGDKPHETLHYPKEQQ